MQAVMHIMHTVSVTHSMYATHLPPAATPITNNPDGGPQPIGGQGGSAADVHLITDLIHDIIATIAEVLIPLGVLGIVLIGLNLIVRGPGLSTGERAKLVQQLVTIGIGFLIVFGAGDLVGIIQTLLAHVGQVTIK